MVEIFVKFVSSLQGGGAVQGNGLDLLPEEGGVDEEENTLDDISGDEVRSMLS